MANAMVRTRVQARKEILPHRTAGDLRAGDAVVEDSSRGNARTTTRRSTPWGKEVNIIKSINKETLVISAACS